MKKDINSIFKKLFGKFQKGTVKGECLTEEDFACIIDSELPDNERQALLGHVLSCPECSEVLKEHLLVLNAIETKGMLETPESVVQAAMNLVNPEFGQNILEIVLNFKETVIELVKTTGDILQGPQLVPVPVLRSKDEDKNFSNEIKIVKGFGDVLAEIEVEKKKLDSCDLNIRLTDKDTKKRLEGYRISLVKGEKEVESSLIDRGKVVFKEVLTNSYEIYIVKDNKKIGVIQLTLKSCE